ncbi:MAG: ABC transporter ATP-binding protein [Lachnospiraceae bacterium]|nr:ABC transporter ATP-binding protein [Lachnospiraceae bacterium]
MIRVNNLTFTYPGAEKPVLKDVNFEVKKGDFLAIVGNNGCGKSTLCKILNGLIPHFTTGEFEGEVMVGEVNTIESDIGELAQRVGYVYQDFENQIVRPTVLDDASYACMNYAMPDYEDRGKKALEQCGLAGKEQAYIWQLSGGQTHLLALAGAVSLQPDVLVLDEPIAQLDPQHADAIYQILKRLNEEYGKTIIVIEHHTEYIADFCKHVLLLKNGHVEWMLPTDKALGRVDELQECNIFPPQVTLAAHRLCLLKNDTTMKRLPVTLEEGKRYFSDCQYHKQRLEGERIKKDKIPSVTFERVSVWYKAVKGEDKKIFDNLNLTIGKGEKIALIGSNGAGKSTLMKMMTGLIKPREGQITLKDMRLRNTKPEKLAKYISLVYQNPEDMFIKDSVYNDVAFAMKSRKIQEWEKRTQELLKRFHLEELANRDGRLLSGGQMRRASLAIGVALQPEILLLDEPTANLDIATRKEIMRTLQELKDITDTVVIATHDMQLVCEWAERIIVLYEGEVVADGTKNEVFGNDKIIDLVGIRPPEIFTMGKMLDEEAMCYTVTDFVHAFC